MVVRESWTVVSDAEVEERMSHTKTADGGA
jgi:hypothetical protein